MDSMSDAINCPKCGEQIEVSQALSSQLADKLRKELEGQHQDREKQFAQREAELNGIEESLGKARESLEQEVKLRLKTEREKVRQQEAERAKADFALEIQDKESQLGRIREKLKATQESELELRKKARELDEEKQEFELTMTRRLDEERAKIRELAKKEAEEDRQLKDAEKDKLIGDLKHQIDDLKRKSEQGSQQLQGEVMELALEDLLGRQFPYDNAVPVPKGIHGGDTLQEVHDSTGRLCGSILWESKRTKAWSDAWLPKLRDDQRAAKAQLAVLVSIELPKDVSTFTCIDGVWVTNWQCAISLAGALRAGLVEVARAKQALDGQHGKMEMLYGYLSGDEFRHRVEGIVEAFVTLKQDLEAEKRATQRMWAKRDKQLERALVQTAGMYGELSGIIGSGLPVIANLESPAVDAVGGTSKTEEDEIGT